MVGHTAPPVASLQGPELATDSLLLADRCANQPATQQPHLTDYRPCTSWPSPSLPSHRHGMLLHAGTMLVVAVALLLYRGLTAGWLCHRKRTAIGPDDDGAVPFMPKGASTRTSRARPNCLSAPGAALNDVPTSTEGMGRCAASLGHRSVCWRQQSITMLSNARARAPHQRYCVPCVLGLCGGPAEI